MDHFLKFLVVGTIGFVINTVVLVFGVRIGISPSLSGPAGAELAIFSNFLLNNFWTFSDKSLGPLSGYPLKFIQFNVLSLGSVVIQFVFLKTGEKLLGKESFKEPFVDMPWVRKLPFVKKILQVNFLHNFAKKFSSYFVVYVLGVGVGLIVNYFIYSQIIWK